MLRGTLRRARQSRWGQRRGQRPHRNSGSEETACCSTDAPPAPLLRLTMTVPAGLQARERASVAGAWPWSSEVHAATGHRRVRAVRSGAHAGRRPVGLVPALGGGGHAHAAPSHARRLRGHCRLEAAEEERAQRDAPAGSKLAGRAAQRCPGKLKRLRHGRKEHQQCAARPRSGRAGHGVSALMRSQAEVQKKSHLHLPTNLDKSSQWKPGRRARGTRQAPACPGQAAAGRCDWCSGRSGTRCPTASTSSRPRRSTASSSTCCSTRWVAACAQALHERGACERGDAARGSE